MMAKILNLPTFQDPRGSLTVLQDEIPFKIARVYWLHGCDGSTRGGHRHIKTIQALVCLSGECTVEVVKSSDRRSFSLTDPKECLLLEPEDWHMLHPQKNAVMVVMASHPYEAADYVLEPL